MPFTKKYLSEYDKFLQTEEGKTFVAPYKEVIENISKIIHEPLNFWKFGSITTGITLMVSSINKRTNRLLNESYILRTN